MARRALKLLDLTAIHLAAAAALAIGAASSANAAGSDTGQLPVTATVANSCSITNNGAQLAFGEVAPNQVKSAQATLAFSCTLTGATPATVLLNNGSNPNASSVRQMTGSSTANTIRYQVCTTSTCGTLWPAEGVPVTINGTATLAVHAQINATYSQADAGVEDTYSDTLTVTLNY